MFQQDPLGCCLENVLEYARLLEGDQPGGSFKISMRGSDFLRGIGKDDKQKEHDSFPRSIGYNEAVLERREEKLGKEEGSRGWCSGFGFNGQMDGGIIHREEKTQICGEDNEFGFVHIDLEEPYPNEVSIQ